MIRPVNDAPRVSEDAGRTEEDEPVSIDVLDNDADVDGDSLRITSTSREQHGNAVVRDGRITWSPARNFNGTASFDYAVDDGHGATGSGAVSVVVAPVNDLPSPAPDEATTQEDVPLRIRVLANDSDLDGHALEVVSVEDPRQGSATHDGTVVTYSPPPDFFGNASFTYRVTDGHGGQASGLVEVAITPVNDSPRAANDVASALESGSVDIDVLANDFDPDGGALTLISFEQPSSGSVAQVGDGLRFSAPDRGDKVSFEYVVRDTEGVTDRAVVTVEVAGINDPPSFAVGPTQTVPEDSGAQTVPGWATAISAGPPDESSQQVTFLVSNTNNALFAPGGQPAVSSNGTLTYTPAANANGTATVTVQVHDDGGLANGGSDVGASQTFTVVVTPVNDPPTAVADQVSVAEDAPAGVTFGVLGNDTDVDGDSLSLSAFDGSTVTEGTLTDNGGGQFTFVPDAAFNGSQTFSYTVADGNGGTDSGVVTIDVTPQADDPVAADDAYVTAQNTPLNQGIPGVLANDSDEDGDVLVVQTIPVTAPSNGTLSLSNDGSFVYTPNLGFTGTDSFTYRVGDGTGLTDDADVTITVSLSSMTSLLYLGTSGPSSDVWDLTTSPAPAASPVPDFDGDGDPGLSIKATNNGESESDPRKWHEWARPISLTPLVLNGPVTLQLWSTIDGFDPDDPAHPYVYLYDCLIGGLACVKIAQNEMQLQNWNGGVADWVYREITVGSVSRTIFVGRELRLRLQVDKNDFWVALTAAYPSALAVTGP